MNHIESSKIALLITIPDEFAPLLANTLNFAEEAAFRAETALIKLLSDLGIPVELEIEVNSGAVTGPAAILVNGVSLDYPESLFRQTWEYAAGIAPGLYTPDYNAFDWLREKLKPEAPPEEEKKQNIDPHTVTVAAEIFALLAINIISIQPQKLLDEAQALSLVGHGKNFLSPSNQKILAKISAEEIGGILRAVLKLRISISPIETVLGVICQHHARKQNRDEIVETLIQLLRPPQLDVEIHPEYLRQILGYLPAEKATPVQSEAVDKKLQEIFKLFSDGIFYELGIRVPAVRFVKNEELAKEAFVVRLNQVLLCPQLGLKTSQILVNESPQRLSDYGISDAALIRNPSNLRDNSLAAAEHRQKLESAGMVTWDATGYIILVLAREMRQNAAGVVDAETVEYDLALVDQAFPALVSAAMEKYCTRQLAGILRNFLAEGISTRDLPSILERLLHYDYLLTDPSKYIVFGDRLVIHKDIGHGRHPGLENFTQYARSGLKDYISHKYTYGRGQSNLLVYLLDPHLENRIVEHLAAQKGKKNKKPLTAEEIGIIHRELRRELTLLAPKAAIPTILTITSIRAFVRDMLCAEFPDLPVLSYDELAPTTNISPIARIYLD